MGKREYNKYMSCTVSYYDFSINFRGNMMIFFLESKSRINLSSVNVTVIMGPGSAVYQFTYQNSFKTCPNV